MKSLVSYWRERIIGYSSKWSVDAETIFLATENIPKIHRNPPVIFHGLKRSGNHVVLNWIKSDGQFQFFNNVLPLGRLIKSGRVVPVQPRCLPFYLGRRTLLISIEDMPVDKMLFKNAPEHTRHVVLVRDPTNLFASRIRKGFLTSRPAYPKQMDCLMHRAIKIWKEHAQLCLANLAPSEDTIGIFFDHWLVDPDYRSAIANWLKISPSEDVLQQAALEGGGSSFQDIDSTIATSPQIRSQVLNRQQLLKQDEQDLLAEILKDGEIQQLRNNLIEAISLRQT